LPDLVPAAGKVGAPYEVSFLDHIDVSTAAFTTVGHGDVYPLGPVRFRFGTESRTGFALITGSGSRTLLEMQRNWPRSNDD
jgi:hypothetical protein